MPLFQQLYLSLRGREEGERREGGREEGERREKGERRERERKRQGERMTLELFQKSNMKVG